jgi:hypothetical protein
MTEGRTSVIISIARSRRPARVVKQLTSSCCASVHRMHASACCRIPAGSLRLLSQRGFRSTQKAAAALSAVESARGCPGFAPDRFKPGWAAPSDRSALSQRRRSRANIVPRSDTRCFSAAAAEEAQEDSWRAEVYTALESVVDPTRCKSVVELGMVFDRARHVGGSRGLKDTPF